MINLNKILSIMCILIFLIPISIIAIENPEPLITDDTEDVMGLLAKIFPQEEISFLDIESVWFTENPDEPDFIYTSIKFVDLTTRKWHTIYSLIWEYKGETYFVSGHYREYGTVSTYSAAYGENAEKITGSFDVENDIVTFIIPKNIINNPQPGEELTNPQVLSSLRPFMRIYSKVIILRFGSGKSLHAEIRLLRSYFLFTGINRLRVSSSAALREIARLTVVSLPSLRIIGTSPQVERVTLRWEKFMPSSAIILFMALRTP